MACCIRCLRTRKAIVLGNAKVRWDAMCMVIVSRRYYVKHIGRRSLTSLNPSTIKSR